MEASTTCPVGAKPGRVVKSLRNFSVQPVCDSHGNPGAWCASRPAEQAFSAHDVHFLDAK